MNLSLRLECLSLTTLYGELEMPRHSNNRANSATIDKKSGSNAKIKIVGEGRDEWNNRYIKLKVNGTKASLPPYSMDDIFNPQNKIYKDVGTAGVMLTSPADKAAFTKMMSKYTKQKSSFKV